MLMLIVYSFKKVVQDDSILFCDFHQDDPETNADLRCFLNAVYKKANLPAEKFNQHEIITRCIDAFVSNGFEDEQSIAAACEYINSDDLSLKEAKVPLKLVAIIYQTIVDFRKSLPIEAHYMV